MYFNSVLISCFLFASAVLASPLQSQQLDLLGRSPSHSPVVVSPSYGGAIANATNRTFNYVHGIFVVPEVSTPPGTECTAIVAIIMDPTMSCPGGVYFQVGIKSIAHSNGTTDIQAQYEWGPDSAANLNLRVAVGDLIELTLMTFDETTGHVFVGILGKDISVDSEVKFSHPLCQQSAGWVVKGDQGYIANFSTVDFTGASVGIRGLDLQGPYNATIVDFHTPQGDVKTSTTVRDRYSLSISHR